MTTDADVLFRISELERKLSHLYERTGLDLASAKAAIDAVVGRGI